MSPSALLDVGVLHPGTDLFQFGHIRQGIGAVLELVSANRGKHVYDGRAGILLGHLFGRAAQRPTAPAEADHDCGDETGERALQQTRKRIPCRIEGISMMFSFDKFCSNEQRDPNGTPSKKLS